MGYFFNTGVEKFQWLKVFFFNSHTFVFHTDITEIFAKSQDPEELKHTWLQWHDAAGAPARNNFTQYVQLDNEAAKLNGNDTATDKT